MTGRVFWGGDGVRPKVVAVGRTGIGIVIVLAGLSGVTSDGVVAQEDRPVVRVEVDRSAIAQLEEVFRVGSVDGPAVQRFGLVADVTADLEAGEVFVLDHLERVVRVFDLSGNHLRSWGRRGEGPGELMAPAALAFARDTVAVADRRRVHVFGRDGTLLGSVSGAPEAGVTRPLEVRALGDGWALTLAEIVPGVTGSVPFERTYGLSLETGLIEPWRFMTPRESLPTDDGSNDWWLTSPFGHRPVGALGEEGVFWAAGSAEYRLTVASHADSVLRFLEFRHDGRTIDGSLHEAYRRSVEGRCDPTSPQAGRCPPGWREQVERALSLPHPAAFPAVGAILPGPGGTALVARRDLDPDPFDEEETTEYDLVHADGRHLGALSFPPRFTPMWLGRDRVFGVQRDELDVPYVVGLALR